MSWVGFGTPNGPATKADFRPPLKGTIGPPQAATPHTTPNATMSAPVERELWNVYTNNQLTRDVLVRRNLEITNRVGHTRSDILVDH